MDMNQLKDGIKRVARSYFYDSICAIYPLYKQINIGNGIEEGFDEMKAFITGKRAEEHALESAVDALSDDTIKSEFQTGSDEAMCAFVASKMPSLTTDDQKLAVAVALQSI